jgi:hypothetical protein
LQSRGSSLAVRGDDEGVDLQQGQILLQEDFVQGLRHLHEGADLLALQAQAEGQVAALVIHEAGDRVDPFLEDLLRLEVRATSSISMPPAAEATKPMRSAARSTVMER